MTNSSHTVPCKYCGNPTKMKGTKLCDPCWELVRAIQVVPRSVLEKIIVDELGEIENENFNCS